MPEFEALRAYGRGFLKNFRPISANHFGATYTTSKTVRPFDISYNEKIAEAAGVVSDSPFVYPTGTADETIGAYIANRSYMPATEKAPAQAFALGSVLNRLSGTRVPFSDSTFHEIFWNALQEEQLTKSAGASDVCAPEAIALVQTLLHYDKGARGVDTQGIKSEALSKSDPVALLVFLSLGS